MCVFCAGIERVWSKPWKISHHQHLRGLCFCGGGDVEERTINAMDLVEDMVEALCADRQIGLNAIVDDIKCAFVAEDGDRYGIEGVGIGYIEVQVYSQSDTGI